MKLGCGTTTLNPKYSHPCRYPRRHHPKKAKVTRNGGKQMLVLFMDRKSMIPDRKTIKIS
jgi:hypothetical protein